MPKQKNRPVVAEKEGGSTRASTFLPWLLLSIAVVLIAIVRIRLLNMPLERDEGEYAYVGQLMLSGVPPYLLAYSMKLPGIYVAYALVMAVFGQTAAGIHLGLLLVNAANTVLMFLLAKRLYGAYAAVTAAAAYSLLAIASTVKGLAANAEQFVLLPALVGLLVLLRALETKRPLTFFWSGLLMGLALVVKQHGGYFVLFGLAYLMLSFWRDHGTRQAKPFLAKVGFFAAGAAIPFAITCLVMLMAGVFKNFWFWTFTYAREYAAMVTPSTALIELKSWMEAEAGISLPLWILAGVGLTSVFWNRRIRANGLFLVSLWLVSAMAASAGMFFRGHYFILMFPAVALLIGAAVSAIYEVLARTRIPAVLRVVIVCILFAGTCAYTLYWQSIPLFQLDPTTLAYQTYPGNPFPETVEVARYIKRHTSPSDRIFVFGSEPQIYFYSHRRSATGYIYMYGLMEEQQYALKMQLDMVREVEANHPKYIVEIGSPYSWLPHVNSELFVLDWANKYSEKCTLVGLVDIPPTYDGASTRYYWGDEAKSARITSKSFIRIYKVNQSGQPR